MAQMSLKSRAACPALLLFAFRNIQTDDSYFTLLNVYVDLLVFMRIAGTS